MTWIRESTFESAIARAINRKIFFLNKVCLRSRVERNDPLSGFRKKKAANSVIFAKPRR